MRIFSNLTTFFYTIILVLVGVLLVALALQLITTYDVTNALDSLYRVKNMRIILGSVGVFLILVGLGVVQFTLNKMQREKTIAFSNPDGQVSIALAAIEDFIKRIATNIPELKDLRSDVIAGKRGVEISTRVTLWSDINIPEVTERLQGLIKTRLQEMLGIEETIQIRVHVVKIVKREEPKVAKKEKEKEEPEVPFRGIQYRA